MLATTLMLLVIFVTNQSLQFMQRAASGMLPATEVLHVIALQLPLLLGYLLPLGLYLGVLLTLGRLYLDSEMTVLSACGMSRVKLTSIVFTVAMVVALLVAWLMAFVVPEAQGDINVIMNNAIVTASVEQIIPDRFITLGKKSGIPITFYAGSVENHTTLHNVFMVRKIKKLEDPSLEKWDVIVAKLASEKKVDAHSERYLVFDRGYRYSGVPGAKEYRVMQFDQYAIRMTTNEPAHLNAEQYYSFPKLWSQYFTNPNAAAELQWRIAIPICTLIFALIAVPLGEVRPRYGKFTQLIPAILIYVSYVDLIFLARAWIQSGRLSPVLGMWWVHGSAFLLAMILMLYRVGWRRLLRLFSRKKFT